MDICIYYEQKNKHIIDILPKNLNNKILSDIQKCWQRRIMREILIVLTKTEETTLSSLAKEINHSTSTIHENVEALERLELIESKISFKKKKQRIIKSKIICVTKNPKFKEKLKKFFQGIWIDDEQTKKIIDFLKENKHESFTAEKISAILQIPVDDVKLNLSNWDSPLTRGVSFYNKEPPFEKEITYRGK